MKRWRCLKQNVGQGLGAGLVAAAILSLLEVALVIFVDYIGPATTSGPVLEPVLSSQYALLVYGLLGLVAGLGLGLLFGLACIWRAPDRASNFTWNAVAVLLVSLGTLLVVANRVGRDMQDRVRTPGAAIPATTGIALLPVAIALSLGLLLLVVWLGRRTRPTRVQWGVGLYLALFVVAFAIRGLLALVPSLTASPRAANVNPDSGGRPNVLVIVADALRADRLSGYGHSEHQTPNLDDLARDGVLYRHMSAQASWTLPSMATLFTSLYPSSHNTNSDEAQLPDSVITLPEVLQAQGYHTAGISVNPYVSSEFNFQQGFDELEFLKANVPDFASRTESRFFAHGIMLSMLELVAPPAVHLRNRLTPDAETVGARALSWLEADQVSPFFLFLFYLDPHDPYCAHPYDGTCVARRETPDPSPEQVSLVLELYDGEVTFFDAHLGEFLDELKARGLYDDLLIVFTADHGEEFIDHGGWWHGQTLYEEVLAVPLIVKYPGSAYAGLVDDELARTLDVAPTVLDAVGLPIPEPMQGVSLQPGAAAPRAEFSFAELGDTGTVRAIRIRNQKLIVAPEPSPRDLPTEALYDLQIDPGEQENLARAHPDTVRLLRAKLDDVIAFAQAHAVATQSGVLDPATEERLRNLGY